VSESRPEARGGGEGVARENGGEGGAPTEIQGQARNPKKSACK
jgi:hypothetical protein